MARFQPSKKATIITIGTLVIALIAAIGVGVMIKGFSSKTKLSSPTSVADKQKHKYGNQGKENSAASGSTGQSGTVQDTIAKERQAITESDKGGFVSAMSGGEKKKEEAKVTPEDILKEPPPAQRGGYDPTKPQPIDKDGKLLSGQTHMPSDKQGTREQVYAYLYSKRGNGGFIAVKETKQKDGEKGGKPGEQTPSPAGSAPAGQNSQLPVPVEYHKPYKAIVDRTFTSGTQNTTFVATLSDAPFRGWKVTGRSTPNFNDLRFNVDVNSVISPDNKPYSIKGFATSIDQSDGIISAVKHDDVAGSVLSGITKGMGTFLDTFRSDTTTVEVASGGVTVTGQNKVSDRGKEAGLAAGSAVFGDMSKKMNDRVKKNPTLIMEKGVPVLIYFMP